MDSATVVAVVPDRVPVQGSGAIAVQASRPTKVAAAVSVALRQHPQVASAAVQAVVVAVAAVLLELSVAREASPPRLARTGWRRGMNSRR